MKPKNTMIPLLSVSYPHHYAHAVRNHRDPHRRVGASTSPKGHPRHRMLIAVIVCEHDIGKKRSVTGADWRTKEKIRTYL